MSKVKLIVCLVCALSLCTVATSQAQLISLDPSILDPIVIGNPVVFNLNMDFTGAATHGGGLDIFYDSLQLSFVDFVFNPLLGALATRPPDVINGTLKGLGFSFLFPVEGPSLVGTLTFECIDLGWSDITMAVNDQPSPGPFIGAAGQIQTVSFEGASVHNVPEPASVSLLLFGLGGLWGASKRRKEDN